MSELSEQAVDFRILSLDGGGVRGALSARILYNIEKYLNARDGQNIPLGHRFDLLAGTSTGGIIALGLAIGRSAEEILAFYDEYIPKIFGRESKRRFPKYLFKPMYKKETLHNALDSFFGGSTLMDIYTDVCIPTVSLQNAKPRLYKSGYLARNSARLDEKLTGIALATSSAPIYFSSHSSHHSSNIIDGGICANNPAMISLIESLQFEKDSKRGVPPPPKGNKRSLDNVIMLSVGTGEQCAMPYNMDKVKSGGAISWALGKEKSDSLLSLSPVFPLVEVLMHSQSQLVHFQTSFLLDANRYLRINPQLKFPMKLDDIDKVNELKNLADITVDIENFINLHLT